MPSVNFQNRFVGLFVGLTFMRRAVLAKTAGGPSAGRAQMPPDLVSILVIGE